MALTGHELLDETQGRLGVLEVRQVIGARQLLIPCARNELHRFATLVDRDRLIPGSVNHQRWN